MWWLSEINDYSETYYPILLQIQKSFKESFLIPIWRHDIFGGMPLFGDSLTMLLNPVNWLSLFIDLKLFFPLAVVISFFIGVLGMRKMLKEFGIKQNIADFYSVIYMILPMSIAHIKAGHLNIYEAVSFYPWVFLFLRRWLLDQKIKYFFLGGIFSVLVLFSHPGMFYILILAMFFILVYFLIKGKIKIYNFLLYWLIIFLLGSVYFLPTIEFSGYINRTNLTKEDIVPVWTVKSIIGGLFFPYPKISLLDQEAVLYPGFILGVLAIYGFFTLKKKMRIYLFMIIFLLFILSLGSFTPIYGSFINLLPFKEVFRVSSRFWYLALILIVFLSAKGEDFIKNRKLAFTIKLLIFLEIIIFGLLRLFFPGRYGIINNYSFYEKYFKNSKNKFRIYSTTHALSQKNIAEVGAALAGGEYPLQLKSYISDLQKAGGYNYSRYSIIQPPYQVYQGKPQPNADLLGKLNVLYIVSPYNLTDKDFEKIDEEKGLRLYKNNQFKEFLYSNEIGINLISYQTLGNKVETNFEAENEVLVNWGVRNYPGWKVKIDGLEIPLYPKNSWYQFKIGDGKHHFEATFQNKWYQRGLLISFFTLSTILFKIFQVTYFSNFPNKTKIN